jgi:outer membrane protein insertion porin family
MVVDEGHKYFFRNITWVGNTKHSSQELSNILAIKKGDIYDQSILEQRLYMNQNGRDVSSLYMDDGYLFFQVTPIEVNVVNDSIDLEMRIIEGKQARINKVSVAGNTKTNDRVIMREIRTKPGQLFNRSDVIRTQRELAQLGYFDQEKLGVNTKPDPAEGTVDLEYTVEEKPSDQFELQGGYGANQLVGSLGVSFNNFSARNMTCSGKANGRLFLPAMDRS